MLMCLSDCHQLNCSKDRHCLDHVRYDYEVSVEPYAAHMSIGTRHDDKASWASLSLRTWNVKVMPVLSSNTVVGRHASTVIVAVTFISGNVLLDPETALHADRRVR